MTKTRWALAMAAIAIAAIGLATAAMHMQGRGPGGHGPEAMGPHGGHGVGHGDGPGALLHLLSTLDLTEAQKANFKELLAQEHPRIEPLVDEEMQANQAMFLAVHASPIDEQAIRTAGTRLGQARTALALEHARILTQVRALLTSEQMAKLDAALREHAERMEARIKLGRSMFREHMADFLDAL